MDLSAEAYGEYPYFKEQYREKSVRAIRRISARMGTAIDLDQRLFGCYSQRLEGTIETIHRLNVLTC